MGIRRATLRTMAGILVVTFAVTGGVVATSTLAPSNAGAATLPSCLAGQPSRVGTVGGIVHPLTSGAGATSRCSVAASGLLNRVLPSTTTPPSINSNGSPPLINSGGPVMNGPTAVVVTPIYWSPTGYTFPTAYKTLTTQFINDVALASGSSTNVFSILTQYESGPQSSYDIASATSIVDTNNYPIPGCTRDSGPIYPDTSGYATCLTDAQIQAELASELSTLHLTPDIHHLYLIFLPEGVETCVTPTNGLGGGQCSLNASTAGFCGYHSYVTGVTSAEVYAVMPYAITGGATGYMCSSQYARYANNTYVGNQSPNGSLDADTAISIMSHEMSEAITDPLLNAWFDSSSNEIGDDCAYIYGDSLSMQGAPGAEYNQTINSHHYFIQEEFSNSAYAIDVQYGCAQNVQASVVFDPNGGVGSMPSQFGLSGAALRPNTFTEAGHVFTGWNTAFDGSGTSYSDGANFAFSDSATLYAQWVLASYSVTFNANGGTGTMSPETRSAPASLTPNSYTRPGYTFDGWNTSTDGAGTTYPDGATYPFSSSVTLYAQWTPNSYSVTFNANGGTGTMSPETRNAPAILSPNSFTRPGYTFDGWNTSTNGAGTTYLDGATYPFSSSVTLYAQWTTNPIIILAFNANGGSGTMANESSSTPTVIVSNTFTRAGYTFGGWNTAPNGMGTPYASGAEYPFTVSVTLYAQWSMLVPSAPQNLTGIVATGSLTLKWSVPTGGSPPSGYEVFAGPTSGGETATPLNGSVPVTGSSFVVNNVLAGQSRYFYITAFNEAGASAHSNEAVVIVPRNVTRISITTSPSLKSYKPSQRVVVRVTVIATGFFAVPSGKVRIDLGSKILCTLTLANTGRGSCRISLSKWRVGRHVINAWYLASASNLGSRSALRSISIT